MHWKQDYISNDIEST